MRASTNSANRRQLMVWLIAGATVAMLLVGAGVVEGQNGSPCAYTTFDIDQHDDTDPGELIELTLILEVDNNNCTPPRGDITIEVPWESTIPNDIDEDSITITADQRYHPQYVDSDMGDRSPHKIQFSGCSGWRAIYDPDVRSTCAVSGAQEITIELNNIIRLPEKPAESDESYEVTIQWGDGDPLKHTLGVDATLDIDGDNEVGYGETVTFTGSGFARGLTVNLYAQPSTNSAACTSVGGSGWKEVGSATVGSDYRFTAQIEIHTTAFTGAGKYQICALDGAGVDSGTSLGITVKAGLVVVGAGSGVTFNPGQEITLSIEGGSGEGGSGLRPETILVAGQPIGFGDWRQAGNNIFVKVPTTRSGALTISVTFSNGETASVNITIAAFDLQVQGIGAAGISMGQTAVASASNLPGDQVCNVTLAGTRLAFLDGDRIDTDGCVPLLSGGRLVGNFVMADQNGNITPDLIRRLLDSNGEETLEITTSTGAKATAEVKIAKPAITFDPADGEVSLRDTITIRGANFPPERNYYNPPNIVITIDGRSQFVYPTGTSWDVQYEITNRAAAGSTLRVEVRIGDYPLSELTALYRIKIAPPELEVNPSTVRVGQPIEVSVSGLEAFTGGYSVNINGGPRLIIDGERIFATDRLGEFTGRSIIPVDYHEDVATPSGHVITLKVYQGRTSIPGVFGNVTLQQQQYVAPTPTPTITPVPTNTPVPTLTPLPTDTPIPPTDTPVPPTSTPPPTATPVPPPTDTPVPPPTVDRTAIVQTVTAAVIPSDDDRTVVDRPASEPASPDGGLSAFAIFWLVAMGVILLAIVALAAALVALRSRRVGPEQPPFDDLPSI